MRLKRNIWTSVIFSAAALTMAAGLNAACVLDGDWFDGFGGRDYTENFQKSFPLRADGAFSLRNTNGFIHVSTWSRDEVDIQAKKIARRNESDLDRVKIEVDATSAAVRVDTIYERFRNLRLKVNYEIKVPEGCRLELVRSTNGDLELAGRFGEVKAGTTNGDIRLESASGRVDLSTTNGTIRANNVKGPVRAGTTNGNVVLELVDFSGEIKAGTTNGSIRLRLSGEPNARLVARTTNGSIRTDIPVTIEGRLNTRRRLEGTLGRGGPLISLETTNGSITISR
ncbi:MAG: DUF4097 domain-containing protein [Candidatus Aminicenantes bacterium]|nr:DUF4097 domain-containing protein [Candidatus Aminicenantes bacterium]